VDRYFVDTNVFLRFLTNDMPDQAEATAQILAQAAAGKIALETSALVIAEIVWTLESYYELDREAIQDKVLAILNTPGLKVEDADLIGQSVLIYTNKNVDFVDAYNACWMKQKGLAKAYTFDVKHFKRLEEIHPLVPGASED
jgi:predicted nucleic-acid-binding protein